MEISGHHLRLSRHRAGELSVFNRDLCGGKLFLFEVVRVNQFQHRIAGMGLFAAC